MQVFENQIVEMRDGRIVHVTNAADQSVDAYRVYDEYTYQTTGEWKVNAEMPAETIFMGDLLTCSKKGELWSTGRTVVSDMSEVVSILV